MLANYENLIGNQKCIRNNCKKEGNKVGIALCSLAFSVGLPFYVKGWCYIGWQTYSIYLNTLWTNLPLH